MDFEGKRQEGLIPGGTSTRYVGYREPLSGKGSGVALVAALTPWPFPFLA